MHLSSVFFDLYEWIACVLESDGPSKESRKSGVGLPTH